MHEIVLGLFFTQIQWHMGASKLLFSVRSYEILIITMAESFVAILNSTVSMITFIYNVRHNHATLTRKLLFETIYYCFHCTVLPTKSDNDVIFCLQLLSKTLTCIDQYTPLELTRIGGPLVY